LFADGRVSTCARTNFASNHLTGVQAHAESQVDTVPGIDVARQPRRLDLKVERGKACTKGMVLQRHRCSEDGHDSIAGELVHRAAVALHNNRRMLHQIGHDLS